MVWEEKSGMNRIFSKQAGYLYPGLIGGTAIPLAAMMASSLCSIRNRASIKGARLMVTPGVWWRRRLPPHLPQSPATT